MAAGVASRRSGGFTSGFHEIDGEREISLRNDLETYFEKPCVAKPYASYFEATVAEALTRAGIEFRYVDSSAWIRRIGEDPFFNEGEYVPDFVTRFMINGKVVVIEPHGGSFFAKKNERSESIGPDGSTTPRVKETFYDKMERFVKEKGEKLYTIVITNMTPETLSYNLKTRGVGKIADEVWHVPTPKNRHNAGSAPEKGDVDAVLEKLHGLQLRTYRREND